MFFKIQIRTYEMDKVAENGIASHWSYKEGKSDMQSQMEQKLQFFRVLMEINNSESDQEYIDTVKEDVLTDSVYVFTPDGDVIELPKGSTIRDYAKKVKRDIALIAVGASPKRFLYQRTASSASSIWPFRIFLGTSPPIQAEQTINPS